MSEFKHTSSTSSGINLSQAFSTLTTSTSGASSINVGNFNSKTSSKSEQVDLSDFTSDTNSKKNASKNIADNKLIAFINNGISNLKNMLASTGATIKENAKSLFESNASQGINFEQIKTKTGATVSTFGTSLAEGIANVGENIVDAAMVMGSAYTDSQEQSIDNQVFGSMGMAAGQSLKDGSSFTENYEKAVENKKEEHKELSEARWKFTKDFVSEEHVKDAFDKFYAQSEAGQWMKDNSYGFDTTRQIGNGVGNAVGVVGITALTGGAAGVGVTPATLAMTGGISGFGSGTADAWKNGATVDEGITAGTIQGTWDALQWYVGGKIGSSTIGTNILGEGVKNVKVIDSLSRIVLDGATAAPETVVQSLIDTTCKDGYYDSQGNYVEFKENESFDDKYKQLFENNGGWNSIIMNALMGAGMSALGESSGLAKNFRENSKISNDVSDNFASTLNKTEGAKSLNDYFTEISKADDNLLAAIKNREQGHAVSLDGVDLEQYKKITKDLDTLKQAGYTSDELSIDNFLNSSINKKIPDVDIVFNDYFTEISKADDNLLAAIKNREQGHAVSLDGVDLEQYKKITKDLDTLKQAGYTSDELNESYANFRNIENNKINNISKQSVGTTNQNSKNSKINEFYQNSNNPNNIKDNIADSNNDFMNQNIKNKIEENMKNGNMHEFLDQIHYLKENNIPEGYLNVGEYEKDIVNIFINDYFPLLSDTSSYVGSIIMHPTMFKELINSDVGMTYLDNFFLKYLIDDPNYQQAKKAIAISISQMEPDLINKCFSTLKMKEFINNMDTNTFISFVKEFNNYSKTSWLNVETLVDKLCSLDTADFYNVYSLLDGFNVSTYIGSNKEYNYQEKILNTIIEKHYNEGTKLEYISPSTSNVEMINTIAGYDFMYEGQPNLQEILSKITSTTKRLDDEFRNKVTNLSDVKLNITDYNVVASGFPEYYNTITFKIGDNIYTDEIISYNGEINIGSFYGPYPERKKAILDDNLRILKIEPNINKSALVFSDQRLKENFANGLNEVSVKIDGIEKNFIVYYDEFETPMINLNNKIDSNTELNSVSINSIKSLKDFTTKVEDDGVYKISYEINKIKYDRLILPERMDTFNENSDLILNLNKFIADNNLTGIENVEVFKVNNDEIVDTLKYMEKNFTNTDILNTTEYGGNQSNVQDLMIKCYDNSETTSIEKSKVEILNNLINKYFPTATNQDRMNLAEKFTSTGCGYIANSNAFIAWIEGIENGSDIFKEKLGFNMYSIDESGSKVYNTEELAFNIFLDYAKRNIIGDEGLDKFINRFESSTATYKYDEMFSNFYDKIGINMTQTEEYITNDANLKNNILTKLQVDKNEFAILNSNQFDLEKVSDKISDKIQSDLALSNANIEEKIIKDIGGHAMLVTGISDDLNINVSSWGAKYKFLIDDYISKESFDKSVGIMKISFSLN